MPHNFSIQCLSHIDDDSDEESDDEEDLELIAENLGTDVKATVERRRVCLPTQPSRNLIRCGVD